MDPVSIAGLVITVGEVVGKLYEYSSAVKDSKDDIRKLTQEIFALKGALEHISATTRTYLSNGGHDSHEKGLQGEGMLNVAKETLASLQKKLAKPKTKFQTAKQSLTWPITKGEVEKYIAVLERCKTWFIMVSINDTVENTSEIYEGVKQLAESMHEEIIARKTMAMQDEAEAIIKWLAPVRPEEQYLKTLQSRIPGTGRWFFDQTFEEWLTDAATVRPIFWVTGKSGSGKTTLFSSIAEGVKAQSHNSDSESYALHYCSLDNAASQKPANVFGSILAQAANLKPEIVELVKPFWKPSSSLIVQNNMTISELSRLLKKALGLFTRFYILIDALNETPYQRSILSTLLSLFTSCPCLRLLVTCTLDPPSYKDFESAVFVRQMRKADINLDIRTYVCYRLETELNYLGISERIRQEVEGSISTRADGVFRWAQLSMDHLATLRTGRDIRKALHEMPTTLNETYARLLLSIPLSDRKLVREALMWLCFSVRPLNTLELGEAVVLEEEDIDLDSDCRLGNDEAVLHICQGLIDHKRELKEVTLAHDSIRSFLTSEWIKSSDAAYFALDVKESHRKILRKCVAYLSFQPFSTGRAQSSKAARDRVIAYPLLPYAAQIWPIHAEPFDLNEEDENLILSFFATKQHRNGGCFDSWVQTLLGYSNSNAVVQTEPLYYAASYSMIPIIKLLLRRNSKIKIDAPGGRFGSTPLFIACWRGNAEAAKLLVEAGAEIDWLDESMWTCRNMAEQRRMDEVVQLMEKIKPFDRSMPANKINK